MNQKLSILVFIGPPGAGKGTLSQYCVQRLGWVQLSTGNLCRKVVAQGTPRGREIEAIINAGKLVSDDLIGSMVEEWLIEQWQAGKTVILDGYPRVRTQADLLHRFLRRYNDLVTTHVIRFIIPAELLIQRLSKRLICANNDCQKVYAAGSTHASVANSLVCDACGENLIKRSDDCPDVVSERLSTYSRYEQELLNFYQAIDQSIVELDSHESSDLVFRNFCNMLGVVA